MAFLFVCLFVAWYNVEIEAAGFSETLVTMHIRTYTTASDLTDTILMECLRQTRTKNVFNRRLLFGHSISNVIEIRSVIRTRKHEDGESRSTDFALLLCNLYK